MKSKYKDMDNVYLKFSKDGKRKFVKVSSKKRLKNPLKKTEPLNLEMVKK